MSDNKRFKRNPSKQKYSVNFNNGNGKSATSSKQNSINNNSSISTKKSAKHINGNKQNNNYTPFTKSIPLKEEILIDSSSLISLCLPFFIPNDSIDKTYNIINDRYLNSNDIDLSIIYGSLHTKHMFDSSNVNQNNYRSLNKQKHFSNLLDNLQLIHNDVDINNNLNINVHDVGSHISVPPYDYIDKDEDEDDEEIIAGINDDNSSSCDSNNSSDSDYDSDVDMINNSIILSNINNNNKLLSLDYLDKHSTENNSKTHPHDNNVNDENILINSIRQFY